MKRIAPSILSADFTKLGEEIKAVEDAGADWIHVDVMDGHFVPNISMGPMIVEAAKRVTELPLDVHLMIENPDRFIPDFISAGADLISVHAEACTHLNRTVQFIKASGARAGAVLNPATPIQAVQWILEDIDYVLIMSVNPGFGGQEFISNSLEKIRQLKKRVQSLGSPVMIQVDGGVNKRTIKDIALAGGDVFVAGSAIFGSDDYKETIRTFRNLIDEQGG